MIVETRGNFVWGKNPSSRRRQFYCERNAVDSTNNRLDRFKDPVSQFETGLDVARSINKQPARVGGPRLGAIVRAAHRQCWD
jgi:hypothetical protein